MTEKKPPEIPVRDSRFPASVFFVYLLVMLLMSGLHMGLIVGINKLGWNNVVQSAVPILYWSAAAVGLTIFTRRQIQRVYEQPMHQLARAARKVAEGDFSVYIAPVHTLDKLDYMDKMILDFNKMVEELGSMETLKTDFFANVSHEIKTPLAVIQNNADLLCREELTKKQQAHAEMILGAARRLSDLITNILRLNKLEKQVITPAVEAYDLCRQLAECALGHEQAWEEKGLSFEADMEDRAEILADRALMELVWNNLLSNAIKFTDPAGTVSLKEWSRGDRIWVSVRDTGQGMSEEVKRHIFDKFYQRDTSHSAEGNGLGLALVRRVLQLNDFGIEVESVPGEGSAFTVTIPRAEKEV